MGGYILKKLVVIAMIIFLLLISLEATAKHYFWPDGWSDVSDLGFYNSNFGIPQYVQSENKVYFITTDTDDHDPKLYFNKYCWMNIKLL